MTSIVSLVNLLKSYHLNGFIQRWVLLQIQAIAVAIGHESLIKACQEALPTVDAANKLRREYERTQHKHLGSDLAAQLDQQIDREVGAIHRRVSSLVHEDGSLSEAAQRLLEEAFPAGLGHHVGATFIEQATHNQALLDVLSKKEHAAIVDYLRLGDNRDRLTALTPRFNQAIGVASPITGAKVHEAELAGENAIMKLVCGIVFAFDETDPAQKATRDRLLAPFLGANDTLGSEYARRAKAKMGIVCADDKQPAKDAENKDSAPAQGEPTTGGAPAETTTPAEGSRDLPDEPQGFQEVAVPAPTGQADSQPQQAVGQT